MAQLGESGERKPLGDTLASLRWSVEALAHAVDALARAADDETREEVREALDRVRAEMSVAFGDRAEQHGDTGP
jgi:hypothetical protein